MPRDLQQDIKKNLQRDGIHFQAVSGSPSFVYTVGMTAHGQPEMIVFGLPPQVGAGLLHHVCTSILSGSLSAEAEAYPELFVHPVLSRHVTHEDAKEHGAQAYFFYEDFGITPHFKQLLWAEESGLYPSDPQAPDLFKRQQPCLTEKPLRKTLEKSDESPSP